MATALAGFGAICGTSTASAATLSVALLFLVDSIVAVGGLCRTQSQDRDRARQTAATQLGLAVRLCRMRKRDSVATF